MGCSPWERRASEMTECAHRDVVSCPSVGRAAGVLWAEAREAAKCPRLCGTARSGVIRPRASAKLGLKNPALDEKPV